MKRNVRLLMEIILLLAGINARLEKRRVPLGRPSRASWQAMLVQMLWGFQFVECLKQFERKISFSMLSNIFKMKKNVMENKNLDQMQSCKRQQRQLEYRYELFKY